MNCQKCYLDTGTMTIESDPHPQQVSDCTILRINGQQFYISQGAHSKNKSLNGPGNSMVKVLHTKWKGILKIILKLSSCQAPLLYLSLDAPRLISHINDVTHKCYIFCLKERVLLWFIFRKAVYFKAKYLSQYRGELNSVAALGTLLDQKQDYTCIRKNRPKGWSAENQMKYINI